jgi:hypothetical protein
MIRDEARLNSEHEISPVAAGELNDVRSGAGSGSKEADIAANPLEDTVAGDAATGTTGRSRRKHRSHRHRYSSYGHHRSGRSKLLLGLLVLVLVANLFIVLLLGLRIHLSNEENSELRVELAKAKEELDRVKPELAKSLGDIESLLKGQLPGLTRIEYDQVISLNEKYLKNIIFNKVNSKNLKGYEFRVVMQNDTLGTVWPRFKIHFFDEHGVHINTVQAGYEKEALMQIDPLGPGEERADSSAVVKLLDNEKMPYFFLIRLN